jgi:hypothetical protein
MSHLVADRPAREAVTKQPQTTCPRCGTWSAADRCPQCGAHRVSAEISAEMDEEVLGRPGTELLETSIHPDGVPSSSRLSGGGRAQ